MQWLDLLTSSISACSILHCQLSPPLLSTITHCRHMKISLQVLLWRIYLSDNRMHVPCTYKLLWLHAIDNFLQLVDFSYMVYGKANFSGMSIGLTVTRYPTDTWHGVMAWQTPVIIHDGRLVCTFYAIMEPLHDHQIHHTYTKVHTTKHCSVENEQLRSRQVACSGLLSTKIAVAAVVCTSYGAQNCESRDNCSLRTKVWAAPPAQ